MRAFMVAVALLSCAAGTATGQVADSAVSRSASTDVDWRTSGEPAIVAGTAYYPSGPTIFFDGGVMVRSASYKGVSIYVDPTKEPYNIVYVPIGGKLMRPYARRQVEQAADTVVPPAPSGPIEFDEAPAPPAAVEDASAVEAIELQSARGRHGAVSAPAPEPARPGASRGIWIAFQDKVWLLSDPQPAASRNLVPIGTYYGFAVYRDPGRLNEIFVASGTAGFLARYTREERR
jgi:hypothetical protein